MCVTPSARVSTGPCGPTSGAGCAVEFVVGVGRVGSCGSSAMNPAGSMAFGLLEVGSQRCVGRLTGFFTMFSAPGGARVHDA